MTNEEKSALLDKYFQTYKEHLRGTSSYITDLAIRPNLIVFTKKNDLIRSFETGVMMSVGEIEGTPIIFVDTDQKSLKEPEKKKTAGLKKFFSAETGLELTIKVWMFMWLLTFFYPIFKALFSRI